MTSMKEKIETIVNNAANRKPVRKYRYIKPFAVLLAAVLLCGVSGCSKNEGEISKQESSLGDSQNISSDNSIEDFEPVPVPEGGWKVESLAKTIRINGEPLPEPFTVDNLGEGYEVKIDNGYLFLYYNDKWVCQVRYIDKSGEADNAKELDSIGIFAELCEDNDFITFNGIHIGSTLSDVESALGRPTVEFETTDIFLWDFSEAGYDDENYFFVIWIDKSNETVSTIAFYLK